MQFPGQAQGPRSRDSMFFSGGHLGQGFGVYVCVMDVGLYVRYLEGAFGKSLEALNTLPVFPLLPRGTDERY